MSPPPRTHRPSDPTDPHELAERDQLAAQLAALIAAECPPLDLVAALRAARPRRHPRPPGPSVDQSPVDPFLDL